MERLNHALIHSAKAKTSRELKETGKGFVYLIECHNFIKVGIAIDIKTRICGLQVGCPYELKLLVAFASNRMEHDERRLHQLWKRYEVRGEWFQVPAGELAFVTSADTFDAIFK